MVNQPRIISHFMDQKTSLFCNRMSQESHLKLIIIYCYPNFFRNPNWWKRRTGLERALTLISIVCSLALVVLVISLVTVILNDKSKDGKTELMISFSIHFKRTILYSNRDDNEKHSRSFEWRITSSSSH